MGNILFDTASTFNGWIADEQHSLEWLFRVESGDPADAPLYPANAAVQVMGSSTFEWVVRQENLMEHPKRWAELYGTTPVFVFTSRDLGIPAGANVQLVSGGVAEHLPAIRRAAGDGDIWVVGGGDLAGQFLDAGALDRIALSVAPVALAGGAPLFTRRIEADQLRLVDARQVGQFARLVYELQPSGEAPGAVGDPAPVSVA